MEFVSCLVEVQRDRELSSFPRLNEREQVHLVGHYNDSIPNEGCVNHHLNRATDIRRNEASDRGLKGGFGPLIHSADFTSFRERVLCSLTGGVTVLGCARASR